MIGTSLHEPSWGQSPEQEAAEALKDCADYHVSLLSNIFNLP